MEGWKKGLGVNIENIGNNKLREFPIFFNFLPGKGKKEKPILQKSPIIKKK